MLGLKIDQFYTLHVVCRSHTSMHAETVTLKSSSCCNSRRLAKSIDSVMIKLMNPSAAAIMAALYLFSINRLILSMKVMVN